MSKGSEVVHQHEMVGYQEKVQQWMENGGKKYYEAIVPTSDVETTSNTPLIKNPRFYAGLILAFASGIVMMALMSPSSVQGVSPGLSMDASLHKNNFPTWRPTQAPSMPTLAPSYMPVTKAPTIISAHHKSPDYIITGVAVGGLVLIGLLYGLYYWGFFGKKTGESIPLK